MRKIDSYKMLIRNLRKREEAMTEQTKQTPLADVLRECRSMSNQTRQQVADGVNVHRQTVYHWEIGKSVPYERNLDDLFDFYSQQPVFIPWLKKEHFTKPNIDVLRQDYQTFLEALAKVSFS